MEDFFESIKNMLGSSQSSLDKALSIAGEEQKLRLVLFITECSFSAKVPPEEVIDRINETLKALKKKGIRK